jgi:phosphatidate cytidylyltransferase
MAVEPTPPPAPGRNLPLAFLSAAILAAVGIGAIAIGKAPFAVVASIVIVLAQGELYAALHRRGLQPATALGLVFGGLICAAAYLKGEQGAFAMFALGIVFTFLWFMSLPARNRQNTVVNVAMTLLPMAYVPLLASYVLMTLAFPVGGRQLMLAVLGLTFGYDILAFFFGSLWGQRALAPNISPRKSWEGVIGATLSLVAISLGIVASLDAIDSPSKAVGLALVIAVFAPLGDLAESLLKRDMGLKDIGSILPGHGGILDRIDSVLLAAPAAFYFFRLVLF